MVTSKEHIREIYNAPNQVLSLHAVAKDVRMRGEIKERYLS
jgi:hypothetical protein